MGLLSFGVCVFVCLCFVYVCFVCVCILCVLWRFCVFVVVFLKGDDFFSHTLLPSSVLVVIC